MTKRASHITSIDQLIDALGGTDAVCAKFDVGASAVSMWKARGKISPSWHFRIHDELQDLGKTVDRALFGGEDPARPKRSRGAHSAA